MSPWNVPECEHSQAVFLRHASDGEHVFPRGSVRFIRCWEPASRVIDWAYQLRKDPP